MRMVRNLFFFFFFFFSHFSPSLLFNFFFRAICRSQFLDGFLVLRLTASILQWLDFVLKQKRIPQSISTSYADHEQTGKSPSFYPDLLLLKLYKFVVPEAYARRVCRSFAQLGEVCPMRFWRILIHHIGARGVSVLFASGDGGVGDGNSDPQTQQCFSNDGKNTYKFLPMFPPRLLSGSCCRPRHC